MTHDVLEKATARLSHEIKNSLTGISGALQVLQDRLTLSSDVEAVFARVHGELHRIEGSVKELSEFASPKSPVMKPRLLGEVIEESLASVPLRATTHVARHYQEGIPPVAVDERLLGQALTRIVLNAEEAMPEGGTLTISTASEGDRVMISIRDTGRGVPFEEVDRIFEPFFSSKMRGLGLGLAISRRLVDAHGGSLSVVSPTDGGTEFVIVLPHGAPGSDRLSAKR